MVQEITVLNPSFDKLVPTIRHLTGLNDIWARYDKDSFRLTIAGGGIEINTEFPLATENFSVFGTASLGHILDYPGGTQRFDRPVLRHRRVSPYYQYHEEGPLHKMQGNVNKLIHPLIVEKPEEFYISGFWMTIAEIASTAILFQSPRLFTQLWSYHSQRLELVKGPWGPVVMGQELAIGIPQPDQCIKGFRQDSLSLIAQAFQERALLAGYSLSATSKSKPGEIVTQRMIDKPGARTLLSRMVLPVSARRACRAEREQRGLREAQPFVSIDAPMAYLEGMKIPDILAQYIKVSATLFADFEHTVPSPINEDGTYPEEWTPDAKMNKDRILMTKHGQRNLRSKVRINKILTEEQYERQLEWMQKKPNYRLDAKDSVFVEGYFVHNYYVSWDDEEEVYARHVKLVAPTGLKGMTEPISTELFAHHEEGLEEYVGAETAEEEEENIERLTNKGFLRIATVISPSAVFSKMSEALMIQGVLERIARDRGNDLIVADVSARKWVSKVRAETADKGEIPGPCDDLVEWLGQELEKMGQDSGGKMYIYYKTEKGVIEPVIEDKTGEQLMAVVGYVPFWRTRHGDNHVGAEIKTFGPSSSESERRKGVRADIHTAKLGGLPWPLPGQAKEKINMISAALAQMSSHVEPLTLDERLSDTVRVGDYELEIYEEE